MNNRTETDSSAFCLQPKRDAEKGPEDRAAVTKPAVVNRERASSSADSTASSLDGGTPPSPSKDARRSLTKYQRESACGFTLKEQVGSVTLTGDTDPECGECMGRAFLCHVAELCVVIEA